MTSHAPAKLLKGEERLAKEKPEFWMLFSPCALKRSCMGKGCARWPKSPFESGRIKYVSKEQANPKRVNL